MGIRLNPFTGELDLVGSTGGGGTITGGANVNVDGVGVFDGQTGTTLNFRGIKSESTALTVALDAGNKTVDLTLDAGLNTLASLGAGIAVSDGADGWFARSLVQPAAGITIANANGVAGNPTFSLANDLAALEGLAGTGIAVRSAADTWVQRSIQVTDTASVNLTITDGNGVLGNPTLQADVLAAGIDHGGLGGLADDDHAQYLLLAGRVGITNDALLSTSGAQGGSISGSSISNAPLSLNASTDPAAPGTVLFHEIVTNISGFFEHCASIDLHNITLTGVSPSLTGFGVGTSNYVAHSNWVYSGSGGAIYAFSASPQLRSDDGGTRTFIEFNAYNFDPELQVGDAGTFTITDVRLARVSPVFGRHGATGTLTIPRFTGIEFNGAVGAGSTVQAARAVWMRALTVSGAISSYYGLDAEDVTATTAIVVNSALSAGATRYFLRSTGDAVSVLTGGVRIGDSTQPTQKLEVLGHVLLDNGGTASELRLREPSAGGASYTGFIAPALVGNLIYTLPTTQGAANSVLENDGTGVTSWQATTGDWLSQYTLLAGRAGAANDTTLTTTAGGSGTLYGADNTTGRLVLRGNSADRTTGSVDLETVGRLLPTNLSSSTSILLLSSLSTLTLSGGAGFTAIYSENVLDYTAAPSGGVGPSIFWGNFTINTDFTGGMGGVATYHSSYLVNVATGRTLTFNGALGVFNDNAFYSVTGTGAYAAGATHNSFRSKMTISSGTFDTKTALQIDNTAGAGTLTNQIGINIASLTKGGTLNASLVSAGTGVEMRHAGPVRFGANAQPTNPTKTAMHVDGGLIWRRTTFSNAAYTIDAAAGFGDLILAQVGTMTATRTVTLPAAATAGAGRVITIKDESNTVTGANDIVIDGNGAETIDGFATQHIDTGLGSVTIYCSGAAWFIIASRGTITGV